MYVVHVYIIYIFKGMLKKVCDKVILVCIADNMIVDTGIIRAKTNFCFKLDINMFSISIFNK